MKSFDKSRFVQYARYDLTINSAFYRNMAIVTAAIIVGITVLCFLFRWRAVFAVDGSEDLHFLSRYTVTFATVFVSGIAGTMSVIYAACIHHPLRTKQSRISVLTLPATNAEKFVWHTLLVIVGGWLLYTGSIVLADGVNALLSLLVGFPTDQIYSITAEHLRYYTLSMDWGPFNAFQQMKGENYGTEIFTYVLLFVYAYSIWLLSAYAFGNAVKYRYNIVWTILALQALEFVVTVLLIVFSFIFGERIFNFMETNAGNWTAEDAINAFRTLSISVIALTLGTAALMWWGNWKLYTKAQITSKLNR